MSIDILSLILLSILVFLVIYFRPSTSCADDETKTEENDLFFHQKQLDPTNMELPLTGLNEEIFLPGGNAFLPAQINQLLLGAVEQSAPNTEIAGLAAAMQPGPRPCGDERALRLNWALTIFVILLGLIFLLLWILTLQ